MVMIIMVPLTYILAIFKPLPYVVAATIASIYDILLVLVISSNLMVLIIKFVYIFKSELFDELTEGQTRKFHLGSSVVLSMFAIFFDNLIATVDTPNHFEILTGDPTMKRYVKMSSFMDKSDLQTNQTNYSGFGIYRKTAILSYMCIVKAYVKVSII